MCRKSDLLDAGRYFFDYHHGTYVNWKRRCSFSHQLVDSLSADELEERLAKAVPTGEWQFFCLKPPSEYVRKKVLERYTSDERSHA
jgi:hypothetical protein